MANDTLIEPKPKRWHKNYTRLMPYYYVNKKANLIIAENKEEKIVRVRKVVKNSKELIIEIAEKLEENEKKEISSRKKLKESSLTIKWDELEEISYQTIRSTKWTLDFIR